MAMTAAGLKAAIIAQLPASPADATKQAAFAQAIATAVVNYIQANAVVPLGIAVATTGSATAQTGATTAPGTVT